MKLFVTTLIVAFASNTALAGGCDYSRDIERTVEIGSVNLIEVEAGAGYLKIKGESGRKDVLIEARLCSSDEDMLEKMDVVADLSSDSAHFETKYPNQSQWGNSWSSASIDLTMTVPADLAMDVEDSSGEARVDNVASLKMTDSSGELRIRNIAGDLSVRDSSGEMDLKKIGGNVEITDSSGGIYASDIKGNLRVLADSSGAIEARRVAKNVVVERDSSGAIDVVDVGGDFTVEKDSTGGIHYDNVDGKVSLPN